VDVLVELERRLDERLDRAAAVAAAPAAEPAGIDSEVLRGLLADMHGSRVLDVVARELRAEGRGYYTIGSSGHEMNAVVGAVTRPGDPALLHYRSGAFLLARARRARRDGVADVAAVEDTLRSLLATRDDPASGGRHKVWGSAPLAVPPQTSTIASHLPKAVGLAIALARPRRSQATGPRPATGRAGVAELAPAPLPALAGSDPIEIGRAHV
jgi:2-oxoisovalerate dehydrogenase E1 component